MCVASLASAVSCDVPPTPPWVAPPLPAVALPAGVRDAAFIADVSRLKNTVRIAAPRRSVTTARLSAADSEPLASLLGGDVIDLVATNYQASALGAVVPNKILVTFDLQVVNKLNQLGLRLPTWPTPPLGAAGPLLFPFEIGVTATSGGVTVNGGNEVIVTNPQGGAVVVSTDWDGNGTPGSGGPHDFFNDAPCQGLANDCFRYEEYGPIGPLGSSSARRVGFLVDPTVGDFRVKMILAADLGASGPITTGTIAGSVSSTLGAGIGSALITVSGGWAGTTASDGSFSIPAVGPGSRTVSVSNLPSGCTAPAAQTVTVIAGQTTPVAFIVSCSVPTGTIAGFVSSNWAVEPNWKATVVVTPSGGAPLPSVIAGAQGQYTVVGLPLGSGSITVTPTFQPWCQSVTIPYTGLSNGTPLNINIPVPCSRPPQTYVLNGAWGPIQPTGPTGRRVALLIAANMGAAPGRPDVNGAAADELVAARFRLSYPGTLLQFVSASRIDPAFDAVTVTTPGAGVLVVDVQRSTPGSRAGNVELARLLFDIPVGAAGNATLSAIVERLLAETFVDPVDPNQSATVSIAVLPIP